MKKVNIILPVYNEEELIGEFNQKLFEVLKTIKKKYRFEIIYIADKSRDLTWEKLREICSEYTGVKALLLSRRFGHQHSLVAGMDQCDGDAVIMMDSDLQHPPEIIPKLLEQYEAGYDIIHTKRMDAQKTGFFKKTTSRLYYKVINLISQVSINESSADFRLISNKVLTVFKTSIREQHQFLRGLFHWVGFNNTCVTFTARDRTKGKSKYNFYRLLKFSITGIVSFSNIPLQMSIWLGVLSSIAGFVYGLYILIAYFIQPYDVPGWTTLVIIVLFLGGIQLLCLGILGEYIGSIVNETKKRPLYIIEEMQKGVASGSPKRQNRKKKHD